MQFKTILLLGQLLITAALSVNAQQYAYVKEQVNTFNYDAYLTEQGIPEVKKQTQCDSNKKCRAIIVNQDGKIIKRFSSTKNASITTLASGRYKNSAYLFIAHHYPCAEKSCVDYQLINSKGKIKKIDSLPWNGSALATRIGPAGKIHVITETAFTKGSVHHLKTPEPIISAQIGFNAEGNISAIAVAESGTVYWSDSNRWQRLSVSLTEHGDRLAVAAIYPKNNKLHYITLYRYINEYNKGLYSFSFNAQTNQQEGGWLFNSEINNIGFDPQIYQKENGAIIVTAKNSSTGKLNHFTFAEDDFSKMDPALPEHLYASGFENEKSGSFLVGVGLSQIHWKADSEVKKGSTTYTDIDYNIADSFFKNIYAQGRLLNTSVTLQYLQNESHKNLTNENDSELSKQASKYLFGTFDFQGLLGPSSLLRLQLKMGKTTGIAEIKQGNNSVEQQEFATEMRQAALLVMQERGFFYGLDYINYTMPSAVGFSDSNNAIVYSNFDPDFGFQALRLVTGYDAFSYSERYETDINQFYWSGNLNIGIGIADLSSQIKQQALTETGKSKISTPIYLTVGADLQLGYLWQRRFKSAQGLGYSFGLGYQASYSLLGAGQSDESDADADTLYLEFSRTDLLHGPFARANIIF